ncbi:MAG TPA: ATP-binding protein [Thermoanaerobaculia bacterium]|nr:ATP-binding protein [Thermoanaerobaculia bacterium]
MPLADLGDELLRGASPADLVQALEVLAQLGRAVNSAAENGRGGEHLPVPLWPVEPANERQLRLAEARYRTLVEQIPAVVFLASVDGVLSDIYVSPQIETLLGFTQKEWTGNPVLWYRQLHPDDRGPLSREFAKTCTTGQPFRAVARAFSHSGELVWIHIEARLVRDESGHPLFLHGIGFDVTEQQRAQETRQQLLLEQQARSAAEESSRRAAFLARLSHTLGGQLDFHAIPAEVVRTVVPDLADAAAVALRDDAGLLRTLAVAHRDPSRHELARELWETDPQPFVAAEAAGAALGDDGELVEAVDLPRLLARARGDEHRELLRRFAPSSAIVVPIRGRHFAPGLLTLVATDAVRRFGPQDLVVAQDVAQRIALAMDNAQLFKEAQDASRLRDEFLATLSHELRTPLNAIVGWTQILEHTAADSSPQVARAVEIIGRNAQVQNQLISDILDVSSIIAGKLVLKVQPVDLASVVQAALDTVRPAAEAKEIELQRIVDPSAGPVSGDPDRLQQVIWNLLANAIKFSPRKTRVEIRLEAIDSQVEVVVADSGPGVDPDFLPYLFQRFRQADASTTRRYGGLGLGLAIVRHLVELHGGAVRADNREGRRGAIFTVTLPRRSVAPAARDSTARQARVERAPMASPSLAGLRVLVVDDQVDARELLAALLERCGAEVTTTGSARQAYEALQRQRYDVLLSDVGMPEEDGYTLMRRIRDLPPKRGGLIPAAALTAYASAQDRLRSLEAGFQMHIAKPVQPAELLAAVASLARLQSSGDRAAS